MPLTQLSAAVTRDQAYRLVDAVSEREDLALTASAHEDTDDDHWIVEIAAKNPDLAALGTLAREILGTGVSFTAAALDPGINWVERSLEGLKPVTAGGFYVYGSHTGGKPPAGLTPLHIEAAQAFGTGHHETTTGCLEFIDRVLRFGSLRYPLDIGTGTGVLAIAIAKRLRRAVVASDIDPIATRTAEENARDNGVGGLVRAITAAGLAHREIRANAPYDLIVANILAGPLCALAPDIRKVAEPGAAIILSGILTTQAQRVIAAYGAQRIRFRSRLVRGDWTTLLLEKL
jgi:ribosomal protein L11 methyltransferase